MTNGGYQGIRIELEKKSSERLALNLFKGLMILAFLSLVFFILMWEGNPFPCVLAIALILFLFLYILPKMVASLDITDPYNRRLIKEMRSTRPNRYPSDYRTFTTELIQATSALRQIAGGPFHIVPVSTNIDKTRRCLTVLRNPDPRTYSIYRDTLNAIERAHRRDPILPSKTIMGLAREMSDSIEEYLFELEDRFLKEHDEVVSRLRTYGE